MTLRSDDVEEFRQIYQEEFGELLSHEEARAMASRVLHLYGLLARPLPRERKGALEGGAESSKINPDDSG
jgi:hypothetical protein